MAQAAVVFDGVWKKFRRGERHDSLRDLVPSLARRAFGRRRSSSELEGEEFWAIKDVSFDVHAGEALGIIGPNGAGKSTALKLLTRILRPTVGACRVTGRVGALIEVAAGFHPDLTGRENIFLQGAIMGMKRADIARRMDEIVEFAGVGDFVDTQVKRYSSGMNARLGFSIAAHLNPDVLIIDEVLSVGDMEFQQRCVSRMLEFKRNGVGIVFVSHDLGAVSRLCDRALLLTPGASVLDHTPAVIEAYVRKSLKTTRSATGPIDIIHTALSDEAGTVISIARPGETLRMTATYRAETELDDFQLGFLVHRSADGLVVYDESFSQASLGLPAFSPGTIVTIDFTFAANLTRGQYDIELHVCHTPTNAFPIRLRPAAVFTVSEARTYAGIAHLDVRVTKSSIPEARAESFSSITSLVEA